jgi:NAD+ synthase
MTTTSLRFALAQMNPIIGDLTGNAAQITTARQQAAEAGADLVITGELGLCGYMPEDLVNRPGFLSDCNRVLETLAQQTADGGPGLLIGAPWVESGRVYNAAILLDQGMIAGIALKHHLPNDGVFDDKRNFAVGPLRPPIMFRDIALGVMICEDMWHEDIALSLAHQGAQFLIILNGSPFHSGKSAIRLQYAMERSRQTGLPLVYVNQVGGQDELVYDGSSFALNDAGHKMAQMQPFISTVSFLDSRFEQNRWRLLPGHTTPSLPALAEIYQALVLGLRDYVNKNGFPGVVLGLSGGIDSALSAVIAVDALGAERVRGVLMPSPWSSQGSIDDALALAKNLNIKTDTISITPGMEAADAMMANIFAGKASDITEENIQSRLRGMILMAISNKFGAMVLTTGNKSELAVGYTTLYGDMCGGFNVLKDIYKMRVYELARWRNRIGRVIPETSIDKPPSAELRPDQTDQDSLPPYDILDAILLELIEADKSPADLIAAGFDAAIVTKICRLLDRSEYKRRQSAPGIKITPRAFGRDRRYPITNHYQMGLAFLSAPDTV